MKALIVEDDEGMVLILKMFLEPITSEIIVANNMEQALREIADAREIELITLDLALPDSDVKETLERGIKEIKKSRPDSLLIVITGQDFPDIERIAISNGADGVMLKQAEGFTPKGFLQFIGSIAKKHLSSPQDFQHSIDVLEKVAASVNRIQNEQS